MKKYEILINNIERVTEYTKTHKKLRTLKMNSIFSNQKMKELAKKVPTTFDKESINKFEKETGLNIKYYVFEDEYTLYEYSRYGVYPDNSNKDENGNLKDYGKFLESADIIVIDKTTKYKKEANKIK